MHVIMSEIKHFEIDQTAHAKLIIGRLQNVYYIFHKHLISQYYLRRIIK